MKCPNCNVLMVQHGLKDFVCLLCEKRVRL